MSPAANVYLRAPPPASARVNVAVFARTDKSRILSDSGSSDRKSRAVAYPAIVAVSVRLPMRMRIFVPAWVGAVADDVAAVAFIAPEAPHAADATVAATATANSAGSGRSIIRFVSFASGRGVMTGSP